MKTKLDNYDNESNIDDITTSIVDLDSLDFNQKNILSKRIQALQNIKEKKIAAADRHRKLQIRNINELYVYEVKDAEAFFQKVLIETREKFLEEINLESITNVDNNNNNNNNNGDIVKKKRIKLSCEIDFDDKLDKILKDYSVRGDIDKIISNTSNKLTPDDNHENDIIANILNNVLTVDSIKYKIGDLVMIFSFLSNEEFSGVITNITNIDIIIRCGSEIGTIFSINLKQINNRRIKISHDNETIEYLKLVKGGSIFHSIK